MLVFRVFFLLLLPCTVQAQQLTQRQSPLALATARYKDNYLKVTYGQPSKRGREVFGKLVPYGQVWRTGANEATELTITRDIQLNGYPLKAGTYSIFSIPYPDHWTIIVNRELGLWGSYNYNDKLDVVRLDVAVQKVQEPTAETFLISIDQKNDKAVMLFTWDDVKISIPIQFYEPSTK